MALPVQKIACVNNAGFVMRFSVEYLRPDGSIGVVGNSGNYPINQSRVIDLAAFGLAPGTWVRPVVKAIAGVTRRGNVFVQYAPNGQTATYQAKGTTLNYSVGRIG